ncbi:MAG: DNA repair protein RecO [Alphaproteobacteria bacterium]|nr:DNA repair protein RecO [Alphaproteobacteria bacterium]NCQ88175.1 DNA repair protein RecO [Alphaproteobacteria bacterium]NCT05318.1 DNA repair protein RecO [Alphaproteobacteria bacterium]
MERWTDQGIVLSARGHGEGGAIVALLTENNGRHAGYVHGAQSKNKRAMLEPGSQVKCDWSARDNESLGTYALEPEGGLPYGILDEPLKLAALLSACSLCDCALPEREGHTGLYHGLLQLMTSFESDYWAVSYVMWEISLLRELGFRLELDKCAAHGDPLTLEYVSPKSGRAVSRAEAAPYKEKLLVLPHFLRPNCNRADTAGDNEDVLIALKMTGHFLEHWVFAHHTKGVPEARLLFQQRFADMLPL